MVKFADHKEFVTDFTPRQIFIKGFMDGMYWRDIYSSVTKQHYKDDYKQFKFLKNIPKKKLNNGVWDPSINKYKVHASLTLQEWERKKWIHPSAYRGWVHWYCKFYSGIRSDDDPRQISRYIGVMNRFSQRKNKSPRLKQALLGWAIDANKDHSEYIKKIKGIKRVKAALD